MIAVLVGMTQAAIEDIDPDFTFPGDGMRRRLPAALDQVYNAPQAPCLAPPSGTWLPIAGVLMILAFLVYQFVIRRLPSSKPKARDSVRDLEAGLLRDDPCLPV